MSFLWDRILVFESTGNDSFNYNNRNVILIGEGFHLFGQGFVNVRAESVGGVDDATILDTAGNDTFSYTTEGVQLRAQDLLVNASGFESVRFTATAGGNDRATITGSVGDDVLQASVGDVSFLAESGERLELSGVDRSS